ncbi:MAG: thioesterase family protein [Leptospirales bacterium]|nr:thioesterase family protein [Leptospirales bacterium]
MPRVQIELPVDWHFQTELEVRVGDVNLGGHLGHDRLVSLLHEARARMFRDAGFAELDIAGAGIIMQYLSVQYLAESFFGDLLRIFIAARDFWERGCELVYRMERSASSEEIARATTGLIFFDYRARSAIAAPEIFRKAFPPP